MNRTIRTRTLPGTEHTEPQSYEEGNRFLARKAAREGIVLLKNEQQVLPLPKGSKVALYGAGAGHTIKGGTGSGDVNEREHISIAQGMRNAGFQIADEEWLQAYDAMYSEARHTWKEAILAKAGDEPSAFFDAYTSIPFLFPAGPQIEKTDAQTAIYVISRIAGEGKDRSCTPGDYLLTAQEEEMLRTICMLYEHVIVIVNAGGLIDLSFLDTYSNIHGLLQIVQPGMEGGNAVADVISGACTPCGHLTDSWAFSYADYPGAAAFSHNDGNLLEAFYEEGIYVGYRYFDTFDVPVRYSFGYGLSYTTFTQKLTEIHLSGAARPEMQLSSAEGARASASTDPGTIQLQVQVTNSGDTYSGREVVQIYVSAPDGRLEKEFRRLAGFAKTGVLAPHESEQVSVAIPLGRLASYDEAQGVWILEAGDYGIWIGDSLQDSSLQAVVCLSDEKVLYKTAHICPVKKELHEMKQAAGQRRRRYETWSGQGRSAGIPLLCADLSGVGTVTAAYGTDWSDPEAVRRMDAVDAAGMEDEAEILTARLTTEQLIRLATGEVITGEKSALGSAGISTPGAAGETSRCAGKDGIAAIVLADGPAGLRLNQTYYETDGVIELMPFEFSIEHGLFARNCDFKGTPHYQYCTAIPVGTLLAQTWDTALQEELGEMIGGEMQRFGVDLWLAPGMNIHRNPLCGRNFEYYSEDPLLSGLMAAAMTRGVQHVEGCGTTIKHFACNNQEDNRMGVDSILSERALREIYLKGFETAVREAQPRSIMTSYNLINGVHAANSYDLCTMAARSEWGFAGVIMTDWTTTLQDETCTAAGCIRAGNDLVMPGAPLDHENLRRELAEGTLDERQLRRCVSRLVRVILQSSQYETKTETK